MAFINALLLAGSNLGNRKNNLLEAERQLVERAGSVTKASSYYETAAWGNEQQPAFYNRAFQLHTRLAPEMLLRTVKSIEKNMGRTAGERWGARLIDIDILLMEDLIFESSVLSIPHPQMHKRRFTLLPLAEIAPDACHPVLHKTIRQLLDSCKDQLEVNMLFFEDKLSL